MASECVDVWFLDDGQIVTRPWKVDAILRRLDIAMQAIGATRGAKSTHAKVKSTVRIFCGPGQEMNQEWLSDYIRESCEISVVSDPIQVLGGIRGSPEHIQAAFLQTCAKVGDLHGAIDHIDDAATEIVLKKACADVSKITYTLRLNGDRIPEEQLEEYTTMLRNSTTRSLGGDVLDEAWLQATCATDSGGFGLRKAEDVALPAFIASRIAAGPIAGHIFNRIEEQGLAPRGRLDNLYWGRTNRAVERFLGLFPPASSERIAVQAAIDESSAACQEWWRKLVESAHLTRREDTTDTARANQNMDLDEEEEETMRPGAKALQKRLSKVVDSRKLDDLMHHFVNQGFENDARRLDDLRDKHQDHSWLLVLNPATDVVLAEDDWIIAARLRLGCAAVSGEHICSSCGSRVLDAQAYHALCCARGESTRGHNRVRNNMHAGFSVSDPGAAMEVEGLIPSSPTLRPADILTAAAHPTELVAVDVGICAPHALDAGLDCTETMRQQKVRRYEPYMQELASQRIRYEPATISCFGRRHPDTTRMMTLAARRAARYRGLPEHRSILSRWFRSVSAEVWRRAARMVRSCLPGTSHTADFLLYGEMDGQDDDGPGDEVAEEEAGLESDMD
jgi:hypothetical protein